MYSDQLTAVDMSSTRVLVDLDRRDDPLPRGQFMIIPCFNCPNVSEGVAQPSSSIIRSYILAAQRLQHAWCTKWPTGGATTSNRYKNDNTDAMQYNATDLFNML